MVRPWKAFWAATMCGRPVRRAILNAVSFASAPELQNRTCESGVSSSPCSRSARRSTGSWTKKFDTCPSCWIWAVTAATTAGWAWPRAFTATPETRSR